MDEVLAYLKKNPTYFLATVDAEGNPLPPVEEI